MIRQDFPYHLLDQFLSFLYKLAMVSCSSPVVGSLMDPFLVRMIKSQLIAHISQYNPSILVSLSGYSGSGREIECRVEFERCTGSEEGLKS